MVESLGTSITAGGASTPEQVAQKLVLAGKTATGISHVYLDQDPNHLASSYALYGAVNYLKAMVDEKLAGTGITTKSVFSDNLVSSMFLPTTVDPETGWILEGWQPQGGHAIYQENGDVYTATNRLAIPRGRYESAGHHLMVVTVGTISGSVTVHKNDQILKTITEPGTHAIAFDIRNATVDNVFLRANNVSVGSQVVLTDVYCVYLVDQLADYVNHVIQTTLDGMGDNKFVTSEELSALLDDIVNTMTTQLLQHTSARNPHGTTYVDTGAAPAEHEHPQYATLEDVLQRTSASRDQVAVITGGLLGRVPDAVTTDTYIRPTALLRTRYLNHTDEHRYSPYSGWIESTMATEGALTLAVRADVDLDQRMATFLVQSAPMVIRYTFATPRPIKAVSIYTADEVAQVTIAAGDKTIQVSLTNEDTRVVLDTATADDLTITVDSLNNQQLTKFKLGFDVEFGDMLQGKLSVVAGTAFVANTKDGPVAYTIGSSTPINTGYLLYGIEYTLSAIVSDGVIGYDLVPYRHHYSVGAQPTYPLSEMVSNGSPLWGTVTVTGITNPTDGYQLYKPSGTVVTNANTVDIVHHFVSPAKYQGVTIVIPTLLPENGALPTSAEVQVTLVDGTVQQDTVDIDPSLWHAIGPYTCVDVAKSNNPIGYDLITDLRITLVSPPTTFCQVSQVKVAVQVPSYDILTHTWSDGLVRQVLGTVIAHDTDRLSVTSMPIGRLASVPVNNFEKTEFAQTYKVPNPFHTAYVTNVFASYAKPEGSFQVGDIDSKYLTVMSTEITQGSLTIVRTW